MEAFYRCRKNWGENALQQIHWLITTKSWWDTVDYLATNCLGHKLSNNHELAIPTASEWIESENLWVRRSAILFQLKYKEKTDTKLLSYLINRTAHEKDFFIKKAIGWSLRQYARIDPVWVKDLVKNTPLQALSRREALKNI